MRKAAGAGKIEEEGATTLTREGSQAGLLSGFWTLKSFQRLPLPGLPVSVGVGEMWEGKAGTGGAVSLGSWVAALKPSFAKSQIHP